MSEGLHRVVCELFDWTMLELSPRLTATYNSIQHCGIAFGVLRYLIHAFCDAICVNAVFSVFIASISKPDCAGRFHHEFSELLTIGDWFY
jgi:hypothetical protein